MKIEETKLIKIIEEEIRNIVGETFDPHSLQDKFKKVQHRVLELGKKERTEGLTDEEKEELKRLTIQHRLILRYMFKDTAGYVDTRAEDDPLVEEREYPNKSTMKKLVLQTKRATNPRKKVYKQTYNPDLEQLKKDFDALVRNTGRDPLKKYTSTKGEKNE